jgi:quinol-cytochrome oxidoreductase complex cytochrome b subunit
LTTILWLFFALLLIFALFIAFVHKHRIFPPESDDEEDNENKEEMSPEKIAKIVKMMSNMDDVEYKKLIENS